LSNTYHFIRQSSIKCPFFFFSVTISLSFILFYQSLKSFLFPSLLCVLAPWRDNFFIFSSFFKIRVIREIRGYYLFLFFSHNFPFLYPVLSIFEIFSFTEIFHPVILSSVSKIAVGANKG